MEKSRSLLVFTILLSNRSFKLHMFLMDFLLKYLCEFSDTLLFVYCSRFSAR